MKILIVCSGNAPDFDFQKHQAFIYDQVEAVKRLDSAIQFDYFFIKRKGTLGYLQCLNDLNKHLNKSPFDWVHAHFATSALLANLQRKVPVVATFHGSDINLKAHRILSSAVQILSKQTIYVSESLRQMAMISQKKKAWSFPVGSILTFSSPNPKLK